MNRVQPAAELIPLTRSRVPGNASLRDAAELIQTHKVGSLPVVDRGNGLVGMLAESDLFRMLTALWDASLAALPATDGTAKRQ